MRVVGLPPLTQTHYLHNGSFISNKDNKKMFPCRQIQDDGHILYAFKCRSHLQFLAEEHISIRALPNYGYQEIWFTSRFEVIC